MSTTVSVNDRIGTESTCDASISDPSIREFVRPVPYGSSHCLQHSLLDRGGFSIFIAVLALVIPPSPANGFDELNGPPHGVPAGSGQLVNDEVEKARAAWGVQRIEIQTAKIELAYWNGIARSGLTCEEVLRQIALTDGSWSDAQSPTEDESAIRECVRSIVGVVKAEDDGWTRLVIVQDGAEVRNTVSRGESVLSDHAFYDGHTVQYMPGMKGVIVDPGNSRLLTARENAAFIRRVPPGEADWRIKSGQDSAQQNLVLVTPLGSGQVEVEIDRRTSILRRMDMSESAVIRRWSIRDYAGVLLPSAGLDVSFRSGKVWSVRAFLVRSAEINKVLDHEDLTVNVPVGTTVMLRNSPDASRTGGVRESGDAVQLATSLPEVDVISTPAAETSPSTNSNVATYLIMSTAFALLGSIWWTVRLRRHRKPGV